MAIPKRVRSNKRIVWHDKKFQVYQKDGKLMYQDRGIWKEAVVTLLSYEEIMALSEPQDKVDELNKAPLPYFNKFTEEWHMDGIYLEETLETVGFDAEETNEWFVWMH